LAQALPLSLVKKEEMTLMKIEIPFLAAALVLIGTSLLGRLISQQQLSIA
jgi:hypothetical protein